MAVTGKVKGSLLLLVSFVLAACAPQAASPAAPAAPAAPVPPAEPARPAAQTVPGTAKDAFYIDPWSIGYEQPKSSGGTLTAPVNQPIANLNPFGPNVRAHPYLDLAYDSLIARRLAPGIRVLAAPIICRLCESWELQADRKTYVFKLRQNVKWHDGRSFTAEDVKFSFEKGATRETAFELRSNFDTIESLEVVDPHTLKLVTKVPEVDLLEKLADGVPIVPKHAYDAGVDLNKTVIGTGPFKHGSFTPDVEYVAVKNPDYWLPDRPVLDRIVTKIIPDSSTRVAAFLAKEADILSIPTASEMEPVQRAAPGIHVETYPDLGVGSFILNLQQKPFSDKRVRRAVHLAIDRDAMSLQLHRGEGVKYLAPSTAPDWQARSITQEEMARMPGFRAPKDQDIGEAKKLLAEAGYPDGFKTTATFVGTNVGTPQDAEAAAFTLRRLGIEVTLDPLERGAADKKRVDCTFDMFLHSVASVRSTPTRNYLQYVTGGSENYCKYSNPEIDKLVAEQAREFDEKKRWEIIKKIQTILLDDVPTVPLAGRAPRIAWHPWVHNWRNFGSAVTYVWFPTGELIWVDKR